MVLAHAQIRSRCLPHNQLRSNQMSGGDTLDIGDGTYSEQLTSANVPDGCSGNPTTIRPLTVWDNH